MEAQDPIDHDAVQSCGAHVVPFHRGDSREERQGVEGVVVQGGGVDSGARVRRCFADLGEREEETLCLVSFALVVVCGGEIVDGALGETGRTTQMVDHFLADGLHDAFD